MNTLRRAFLRAGGVALASPFLTAAETSRPEEYNERVPLDGAWRFRAGESGAWTRVEVPHTWQVNEALASYQGVAWYQREFDAPASWAGRCARVEFEAVYHSAEVTLNNQPIGRHQGKGYTAFTLDLSRALLPGGTNTLAVRVDNSFNDAMLPRGKSFDWTVDGGITRPVSLLVSPPVFIERIEIDAQPDLEAKRASLDVALVVRNTTGKPTRVRAGYRVIEEDTGRTAFELAPREAAPVQDRATLRVPGEFSNPRLWHFDHPHLYRLEAWIDGHRLQSTFGIRKFEVRADGFYLNGERVKLTGLERMAGSHPEYGMAEPESWIIHDHDDMKELNCIFTRVHWAQDRRVLDYCDRHGILIQLEVPSWGGETFRGMGKEPSAEILENGLGQLREMIARDRNHPSVFAWGLCNEVNGQNPAAQEFVRRMYRAAKELDPHRPCTYASNSLQKNPERDVAGEMDFISWNEYFESWYGGATPDLRKALEAIHRAFPQKTIVISEYGYCECRPEFTAGDAGRIRIMREHTAALREYDYVGGAIFFCYNDYRTHIGDKGVGVLKQRVHGVVDVYGNRKPSFEELRKELGPVETIAVGPEGAQAFSCALALRKALPAYTLSGYSLRWIAYGHGGLPMEQHEEPLEDLRPGGEKRFRRRFELKEPLRVRVDLIRPTRFSAATAEWSR